MRRPSACPANPQVSDLVRRAVRGQRLKNKPKPASVSYPRRRGDDGAPAQTSVAVSELPPQARGRRGHPGDGRRRTRATPAGAGTTPLHAPAPPIKGSYPRRRGDDIALAIGAMSVVELPPQARGRRLRHRSRPRHGGATPAGAGTTCRAVGAGTGGRSYPRRRGDDVPGGGSRNGWAELPPQARGRPCRCPGGGGCDGATPAGAGTTSSVDTTVSGSGSYPRRRGDDLHGARYGWVTRELPPQARGRRRRDLEEAHHRRATPAGAGTTPRTCTSA